MNLPSQLLIAFNELGTAEYEDFETQSENPQIADYLSTVDLPGDDEIPWCSAFVNWCLQQAGLQVTYSGLARSFLSYGLEALNPMPGDIVVFKRTNDPTKGHVAFFLDTHKDWIYVLGGNQQNRVGVNAYRTRDILSYRRPI